MKEQVTPITDQDAAVFNEMRTGLRSLIVQGGDAYDTIEGKLAVIDATLRDSKFDPSNVWLLQALGLTFGDALAQQLGMTWAIVTDANGRVPVLILPGTSSKLSAFTTIQKRVAAGEPIEVFPLFSAFCDQIDRIRTPPKSFFKRLFGSRLT